MATKIQKSLDYNKLLEVQAQGKQLKKILQFPLIAQIKYDGNYVVIEVTDNGTTFHTSGGLTYTHSDNTGDIFNTSRVLNGYYIAERIANDGKLGQRRYCALTGPKTDQKSINHSYKVHDYISINEYTNSRANTTYSERYGMLCISGLSEDSIIKCKIIKDKEDLEDYLITIANQGYEGLVLKQPDWLWKDTKSRTIDCVKYKKRPTADLLCTGYQEGEGKYEGMIGSLLLEDSTGREVYVGSGLSDNDRSNNPLYFIGQVIEIEYEQIIDTYIQPTFITIREGKEDID